ncbi:MAG: hypothetical protein JSR80_01725 [Verrucomicrobia bacterium]|nr:hypothetical protein [Verrucomicrobiota bacterium]
MKWLVALVLLMGCVRERPAEELVKVNIIDQNGMNETIAAKERLARFKETNFLAPQPYKKVFRSFSPREDGKTPAVITSYYASGGIHQLLQVVDGRAFGDYFEWHPNGQQKLQASVVGGSADLDESALRQFVFDGPSSIWNQEGQLIASMTYAQGVLDGETLLYYDTGAVMGKERYQRSLLETATYWNEKGTQIATIEKGFGIKALLQKEGNLILQRYQDGEPQGEERELDRNGNLIRISHYKGGAKDGEEIFYFPTNGSPRLKVQWKSGVMQGLACTWYPCGQLQSQREMCGNRKDGMTMAWFENGALMLIEEYRADQLVRGEYYNLRGGQPVSRIEKGCGDATLYDLHGNFLQTLTYIDGIPTD